MTKVIINKVPTELEMGYYLLNGKEGENKMLYWDGEKWMKPVRDRQGSYFGWIRPLEKQPKIIKSVELVRQ